MIAIIKVGTARQVSDAFYGKVKKKKQRKSNA